MPYPTRYRGRFAPSPTGPLHFGSLVAALGSYLDAKHHNGIWLVRIEDLDTPRTVKGAANGILRTLEACGLHWDETVIYQSQRTAAYQSAFERLCADNLLYPCACSRKEIADSALHGIEGPVYPGTCRNGFPAGREGRAWRLRTGRLARHSRAGGNPVIQHIFCSNPLDSRLRGNDLSQNKNGIIEFDDALQGRITQHLENEIGDFVVLRADGLFAYQLAVVVDDAFQGITHVVRGADLLTSTTRQIYLQQLLGLTTPAYMHLPIAVNARGEKLSKQTLANPVDTNNAVRTLLRALTFLRQEPPAELSGYDLNSVLGWAIAHWDKDRLNGVMRIPAV